MKLPILTDPDLQEALTNARVCQGNDRDDALRVIAVTLFGLDSPTARLVLEEVSPEMRVFAWLAICELVDDSTAIDDGLKSADLYVERKPTKEEPAPLQREDLRRFFEVLRACRNENWPLARSIADEVQSMLLHLEVLEAIADISELSEDQAAAGVLGRGRGGDGRA